MKNFSVLIFVLLIIVILMLVLFSFQVRETEMALVTTFGKPGRSIEKPGWYFKWPPPINVVHKFDSRSHLFSGPQEETNTKGQDPIVVTSYAVWKIADPLKFLESVRDKPGAEKQLRSLLRHTQNSVVGQHYFSEFVNSDPQKIKFAAIEEEMLANLSAQASANYGIEVRTAGIKQLGISKDVTKNVFDRMKADRQKKTEMILGQGRAEATKIRSDADMKRTEILAVAEAQSKAIRGAGDAEAAKYYKMLEADPEFAMFLRNIDALRKMLKEKTTIIMGADTEPLRLLKEMPEIKPRQ